MVIVYALVGRDLYTVSLQISQQQAICLEHKCQLPEEPLSTNLCTLSNSESLYYISKSSCTLLKMWNICSNKCVKECMSFDQTPHHLISFQNKIYGYWLHSMQFFCYDPLSSVLEIFNTKVNINTAYPISNSFTLIEHEQNHSLLLYNLGSSETYVAAVPEGIILGYQRQNIVIEPINSTSDDLLLLSGSTNSETITSEEMEAKLKLFRNKGAVWAFDDVLYYCENNNCICTSKYESTPFAVIHNENNVALYVALEKSEDDTICALCLCEFDDNDGVTLDCGHQFHKECLEQWVGNWDKFEQNATHIVFTHAFCPGGCKCLIRHPTIEQSQKIQELHNAVQEIVREILPTLGPTKVDDDILTYMCYVCHKPFYGGERVCSRMLNSEPYNTADKLLCEECRDDFSCPLHGRSFILYKCTYCCNPAIHRSFATRYLCERCDTRWDTTEPSQIPCPGSTLCPLMGVHKSNDAYAIGCFLCMSSKDLNFDRIVPSDQK